MAVRSAPACCSLNAGHGQHRRSLATGRAPWPRRAAALTAGSMLSSPRRYPRGWIRAELASPLPSWWDPRRSPCWTAPLPSRLDPCRARFTAPLVAGSTTSTKIVFAGTLFFFTGGSQYHGASRKISEGPTRKPPV